MIRVKRVVKKDNTLKLFTDFNGALEYLIQHISLIDPGPECKIFTYGVYAGLYHKSDGTLSMNMKHPCFRFLEQCVRNNTQVTIFIGRSSELPDYETQQRIRDIRHVFGSTIVCKEYTGHHKLLLLSDGWGYFGSCNFTGSSLGDLIIAGNLYEISSGITWDKTLSSLISGVASHKN